MLTSLDEARALVLGSCAPFAPRPVPVREALGLVTAEPAVATLSVPRFANSAMDGYAVRAADTAEAPSVLRVVGAVAAGSNAGAVAVGPGQAMRIATGAPMPGGADAVVMVEHTDGGRRHVTVERGVRPGKNVRLPGEDVVAGAVVFAPGTELHAAHLGSLVGAGVVSVCARPRPRVAVVATGDELCEDAAGLRPGAIPDSNRVMLQALLTEAGCHAVDGGIVADDEHLIRHRVAGHLGSCDAVVTSGGVSVGEHDVVAAALGELGRVDRLRVAVKPSKPLVFALANGKPVFGLPGNPVSSMVSFELFVRPALRRMAGHLALDRPRVQAVADEAFPRAPDGKVHLVRSAVAYRHGEYRISPAGPQGSHQLRASASADALVVLPDGYGAQPGETVEALLLRGG